MRRDGAVTALVRGTLVARHPVPLMEEFDDLSTQTHLELFFDQAVGHGVIVPGDFHVVVDVLADQFPLGILVGLRRQRPEGRTVEGLETRSGESGEILEGPPD